MTDILGRSHMKRFFPLFLMAAAMVPAGCGLYKSSLQEGPTLGENPELLGPNLTAEIEAGEFFVGPHDEISIQVYGHPDLTQSQQVEEDGTAYFHLVREVPVAGLSQKELRERLTSEYSRFLVEPSLTATVAGSPRRKVTVLGSVQRAGVYNLTNPRTSILDLLAMAGGVAEDGDRTGILIGREVEPGVRDVKVYDLDLLVDPPDINVKTMIPYVHPGDVVYVLKSPAEKFMEDLRPVRDLLRTILIGENIVLKSDRVSIAITD